MSVSIVSNCLQCSAPVCQRAFTLNLAFGHDEDQYCLCCLSKLYEQEMKDLFETGLHYVQSRECFQKAWEKQKDPSSCPLPNNCVFNRCFGQE